MFYKINFDGSVIDDQGGASFVIHDPGLCQVLVGGCHLFAPTVSTAEIRRAWVRILYVTRILQTEHLIIEDDSATIISWIREAMMTPPMHPLMHDIVFCYRNALPI